MGSTMSNTTKNFRVSVSSTRRIFWMVPCVKRFEASNTVMMSASTPAT
jgi:hypothetical protein